MTHPPLWHFTCAHGRAAIGESGWLRPPMLLPRNVVPWPSRFVWLTDLPEPERDAVGLTSYTLRCDRMEHRYRVDDPSPATPWTYLRQYLRFPAGDLARLEGPGTRPDHWWVSQAPVHGVLDPVRTHA